MDDKIIVTNNSALVAKYKAAGVAKIKAAVNTLIAADKARGINSRLVYLDDAAAMKKFGGKPVTAPKDPRENKEAIDAIFRKESPEYLMILGAIDVVPHQDLKNPVHESGDDDPVAFGDLPYACDAPYSRDVATFKGPSRVVGRLPDLTGAKEPSHILKLLAYAAKYQSKDVKDYGGGYFGLSAYSWRKSTDKSLFEVFGNSNALTVSPTSGPTHPAGRLAPLSHFINCHGGPADWRFYGQKGNAFPESLTSKSITGKIKPGTVAAVECCYGAEMYNSVTLSLPVPICQNYLVQGAYGYFGSSTIAYGPAEGNSAADLITQYFLLSMMDGASLGRAALVARQRFVQQTGEMDVVDLKTLAQFSLLGDPSIHPVKIVSATSVPKGVDAKEGGRVDRLARRAKLRAVGKLLDETKPTASKKDEHARKSPTVRKALASIAREAGMGSKKEFTAFKVTNPQGLKKRGGKASSMASRYHVAVKPPKKLSKDTYSLHVVAVVKEVAGRIVGYRIYTER